MSRIPLTTMVELHTYHDANGNWAYKITAGSTVRLVSTGYKDRLSAVAEGEDALGRVYEELKDPDFDNLLELLQIAEEMMFREKNRNSNLVLTHKMLQGVLKNYYELRNI